MGINIKQGEKILVVAPHPDDESIGCGGLIGLYHDQVDVLLVTDGYDCELNNREISEVRQQEFRQAMNLAQVHDYKMLHIPEHQITQHAARFDEIHFGEYAHIFVPNRYEIHQDHVAVYKIVKRKAGRRTKLYEYEVWTTLRNPNVIVDISASLRMKENMICAHASQVRDLDYWALAVGLNAYRGRIHGLEYAEAFYCRRERYEKKIRHMKRKIRKLLGNSTN